MKQRGYSSLGGLFIIDKLLMQIPRLEIDQKSSGWKDRLFQDSSLIKASSVPFYHVKCLLSIFLSSKRCLNYPPTYCLSHFKRYIRLTMERRPWTNSEDSILQAIVTSTSENLPPWNDIAQKLKGTTGIERTGKQCRERWTNQLRPELTAEKQWSQEEQDILFEMHLSLGNHWSEIAKRLKGRSDNSIKNFFHSALKKALRKVNHHIRNNPVDFRNTKPIKDDTLGKLLKACGPKHQNLVNLGVNHLPSFAMDIKKRLVQVISSDDEELFRQLGKKLTDFNRVCRKSKSKKKQEQYFTSEKSSFCSSSKSNKHSPRSVPHPQQLSRVANMAGEGEVESLDEERKEIGEVNLTEEERMGFDEMENEGNEYFPLYCDEGEISFKLQINRHLDEDEDELNSWQMKNCFNHSE